MSMTFPGYLALTATEFTLCDALPAQPAWMACHYSCYGTALSNLPEVLPKGAMLIVNDRTPPAGHDPRQICAQLEALVKKLSIGCVLLDLQRPDFSENMQLAAILQALPCPVAVSALYAQKLTCPVFLPPVPVNKPIDEYLLPWKDREIWLEAAFSNCQYIITEKGCEISVPGKIPREYPHIFREEKLQCHYCMDEDDNALRFTLWREPEDLLALMQEAQRYGVTKAVGLYQELGKFPD